MKKELEKEFRKLLNEGCTDDFYVAFIDNNFIAKEEVEQILYKAEKTYGGYDDEGIVVDIEAGIYNDALQDIKSKLNI